MSKVSIHSVAPYVLALVVIAIATAVVALTARNVAVMIGIFFATVAVVGWHGGIGPALFTTVATYFIANAYFLDKRDAFTFNSTAFVYIFVCLTIAAFSEISRRSTLRSRADAQRIREIIESITDGFVVVDAGCRLTFMNHAAEDLNRRHQSPTPTETEASVFPLTLAPPALDRFKRAARTASTVEFEYYHQPWDRWFEFRASPTGSGGLTIYFRDVTDRKHNEDEMRLLAAIIESSEDAVIGADLSGTITSWNQAAEKLFGYKPEEAIGHPVAMLLPPEKKDEEAVIISRIRSGEQIRHFDTTRVTKDGRRIPVSLSLSVIRNPSGEIVGYAKIARDISDRKQAEKALLEADRRKDDFLALLGHELRNPLAGIVHGAEMLRQLDSQDSEISGVQSIIERQAAHMTRLIDDLLDVSRIVRSKIKLDFERIDLAALARQTTLDHRAFVEQAGLSLRLDTSEGEVWVEGDRVRLAQVLSNLLNNAIKFTDHGGRVSVSVGADLASRTALLEVRDTGIGMKPDTIATLFEPFAQAHGTLERGSGGLGLGLAVVRGLVALHQGTIKAASPGPRLGSMFTVRLPLRERPKTPSSAVSPAAANLPATADPQRRRVLIVDDNRDVLHLLGKLLERGGHTVSTARDGPSGISAAREFHPDLVLCDIGLPGEINGYKVAQALRADPVTSSVHLVAITGFGQEDDRRRAIEAGFDRHLTKPVGYNDLMNLIDGLGCRL